MEVVQVSLCAFLLFCKETLISQRERTINHNRERLNVSYTDPIRLQGVSQMEPGGLYLNPESHRTVENTLK